MIQAKCIQKFRDKSNRIFAYRLVDSKGQMKDVAAESLKRAILSNQIHVINLKLTSDNRLVDINDKVNIENKKDKKTSNISSSTNSKPVESAEQQQERFKKVIARIGHCIAIKLDANTDITYEELLENVFSDTTLDEQSKIDATYVLDINSGDNLITLFLFPFNKEIKIDINESESGSKIFKLEDSKDKPISLVIKEMISWINVNLEETYERVDSSDITRYFDKIREISFSDSDIHEGYGGELFSDNYSPWDSVEPVYVETMFNNKLDKYFKDIHWNLQSIYELMDELKAKTELCIDKNNNYVLFIDNEIVAEGYTMKELISNLQLKETYDYISRVSDHLNANASLYKREIDKIYNSMMKILKENTKVSGCRRISELEGEILVNDIILAYSISVFENKIILNKNGKEVTIDYTNKLKESIIRFIHNQ